MIYCVNIGGIAFPFHLDSNKIKYLIKQMTPSNNSRLLQIELKEQTNYQYLKTP